MLTDRVGKYRIIAKLGQGGMATVFLSVVPGPVGFNKLLVVKLLKEDLSQDVDFLAMFLNEARLAARLNHANVVQTYEVGVDGDQHFLAMDFLDGQPLNAILRRATRERMPLDIHVRILADVLAGLHYAHTLTDFDGTPLHVVHRDVSPQNVFVTYDGHVKLVDFGIAKAAGATNTTQSGVFKGKLAYVAPEQAGGDPVDPRADIFSVGVMLWEAIACTRFAQGEGQTAVLARRLSGTEPRIRAVVPDADAELADICDRAMAHDPKLRFESAQAFRDALENFLDRFSRRVGSREVGDLVSSLFGEERTRIRQIIDEQMKRVMRETSQELPLLSLNEHAISNEATPYTAVDSPSAARRAAQRASGTGYDPALGTITGTHGTLVTSHVTQRPVPSGTHGRTLLFVLSGMALASIAGIVLLLVVREPTVETAPPVVNAAPSEAPVDAERIKLSITFGPPGAIAKLDGVPLLESPFTAQVPRDGSLHRIDVEGPGLAPQTQMVSYEKDVTIAVVLDPAADPVTSAAASASTVPSAPTSKWKPGEGAWGGPGGALPAPANTDKPLPIDEQDPYKQDAKDP